MDSTQGRANVLRFNLRSSSPTTLRQNTSRPLTVSSNDPPSSLPAPSYYDSVPPVDYDEAHASDIDNLLSILSRLSKKLWRTFGDKDNENHQCYLGTLEKLKKISNSAEKLMQYAKEYPEIKFDYLNFCKHSSKLNRITSAMNLTSSLNDINKIFDNILKEISLFLKKIPIERASSKTLLMDPKTFFTEKISGSSQRVSTLYENSERYAAVENMLLKNCISLPRFYITKMIMLHDEFFVDVIKKITENMKNLDENIKKAVSVCLENELCRFLKPDSDLSSFYRDCIEKKSIIFDNPDMLKEGRDWWIIGVSEPFDRSNFNTFKEVHPELAKDLTFEEFISKSLLGFLREQIKNRPLRLNSFNVEIGRAHV